MALLRPGLPFVAPPTPLLAALRPSHLGVGMLLERFLSSFFGDCCFFQCTMQASYICIRSVGSAKTSKRSIASRCWLSNQCSSEVCDGCRGLSQATLQTGLLLPDNSIRPARLPCHVGPCTGPLRHLHERAAGAHHPLLLNQAAACHCNGPPAPQLHPSQQHRGVYQPDTAHHAGERACGDCAYRRRHKVHGGARLRIQCSYPNSRRFRGSHMHQPHTCGVPGCEAAEVPPQEKKAASESFSSLTCCAAPVCA